MKVISCTHPENGLTEDHLYFFHFEDYESEAKDANFFLSDAYQELQNPKYNDKQKIILTLEEPNFCTADGPHVNLHNHVDTILTICPYFAEHEPKRQLVFFPFNERYIPNQFDKDIDVVYFGSFPNIINWGQYLSDISNKYQLRWGNYQSGTDPRCSYSDKIRLYSRSKIALVHGLCNVSSENIHRYLSYPVATNNPVFSSVSSQILPQIKSRMFEAAFCKSLILCQKDLFNPIEHFFEPKKEFLYFNGENELLNIIDLVVNNYSNFQHIVDAAFNRAINNYTVGHFVKAFLT